MSVETVAVGFIAKWWWALFGWIVAISLASGRALQRIAHLEKDREDLSSKLDDYVKDQAARDEKLREKMDTRDEKYMQMHIDALMRGTKDD